MNSFVELWLTTSKNEEIECVEGTIDENEIENNDQEEPT